MTPRRLALTENAADIPPAEILYLYSSNIRPLYEQDILDLIGQPAGTLFKFRYHGTRYVSKHLFEPQSADAPAALRKELVGRKLVVHFSVQHNAEYHDPVFVPVREGVVRRTESVGEIRIIEFELGPYVALARPPKQQGAIGQPAQSSDKTAGAPEEHPAGTTNPHGRIVRDYADLLRDQKVPRPYKSWAGFGPDVRIASPLIHQSKDQQTLFDTTTLYLSKTKSFQAARFLRVSRVIKLGSEEFSEDTLEPSDEFTLEAGQAYALEVVHSQHADVFHPEVFKVSVDDTILRVAGRGAFELSSTYDVMRIPIHAASLPTSEARHTVLVIEPPKALQGPRIQVRFKVVQPVHRTAAAIGGSAATALLLGLPVLLPTLPVAMKAFLVFLAATLGGLLASFGMRRG